MNRGRVLGSPFPTRNWKKGKETDGIKNICAHEKLGDGCGRRSFCLVIFINHFSYIFKNNGCPIHDVRINTGVNRGNPIYRELGVIRETI